jgi:hypothetical protein
VRLKSGSEEDSFWPAANGALLPVVTEGMGDNGLVAVSFAFTVFDEPRLQPPRFLRFMSHSLNGDQEGKLFDITPVITGNSPFRLCGALSAIHTEAP